MVWDSFHILQMKDKMRIGKYFLVLLSSFLLSACCGLRCQFESSMNGKVGYPIDFEKVKANYGHWYFHQSEKERRYEKIRENEEETEYMFYFWTVDEVNPFPCRYTLTVDKESNTVTSWKELRESDGKYHCVGNW